DAAVADIASAATYVGMPDPLQSLRDTNDARYAIKAAIAAARVLLERDAGTVAAQAAELAFANAQSLESALPQVTSPSDWLAAQEDMRQARASSFAGVAGIFFALGQAEDGERAISAASEELRSMRPGRARFAILAEIAAALGGEHAARAAEAAGEARD